MDEQLLIKECKEKKSYAYRKLYELYAPAMMSVCVRYVNDKDVACDILQEGFIKIFTKIHTYSGKGSFVGWIRRIFVTTALEYLRLNTKFNHQADIMEIENTKDELDVSVLDKLSADELHKCVSALPEGYRTVFNLFAIEGYSHKDIADMLNIKEVTSRTQFIRARKLLQENVSYLITGKIERKKRT